MISEHLNSKVKVDDVENILNPTKENNNFLEERRKNTTVISSSRNSIDTEDMDIVNDSDSVKNPKMNEEAGVISRSLEATTEMISEHLKSKVEFNHVANILKITRENKEMNIVNDSDSIKNPKMNEEDGVISKPLEATTEMISEHLNSKVEVDDVENILIPTKENNNFSEDRRKNPTVISSSRNSILDRNIPTTNMLTHHKQILPSKSNNIKHTLLHSKWCCRRCYLLSHRLV